MSAELVDEIWSDRHCAVRLEGLRGEKMTQHHTFATLSTPEDENEDKNYLEDKDKKCINIVK